MMKGETIKIFNHGNCKRDFTYIDDIVNGVEEVLRRVPKRSENGVPCKIYNIGNNSPENLLEFVHILEHALKCEQLLPADYDLEAHMELVGMQPGDVEVTYADITEIKRDFNFQPKTDLRDGMKNLQNGIRTSMLREYRKMIWSDWNPFRNVSPRIMIMAFAVCLLIPNIMYH